MTNTTSQCTDVFQCASGELHVQLQMPCTEYNIGTTSVLRVMSILNCFYLRRQITTCKFEQQNV